MSVSTATVIDSSRHVGARREELQRNDPAGHDRAGDDSLQAPALFRRPTAAVAYRQPADGGPSRARSENDSSAAATTLGHPARRRTAIAQQPAGKRTDHRQSGRPAPAGSGRPLSPPSPPVSQAARDLLADAARGLDQAMAATTAADRYAAAHLAALRAAAAVLAAKAKPVRGRRGSAWELISKVAPEFSEWAAFFAAGSAKRQAAEAGIHRLVSPRDADDMVRQVAAFLDLVEDALVSESGHRQRQRRAL